jgi:glycosyl transferase family 1
MIAGRPSVLLICERYQLHRNYISFHQALDRAVDVRRYFVDDGWPQALHDVSANCEFDAVIFFVRFRELVGRPAFQWGGYNGLRVMYDQDAYQNFSMMAGARFRGQWPAVFVRHRFDFLVCTGGRTAERLAECGVRTVWIPKAADPYYFSDHQGERVEICHYGTLYAARRRVARRVEKSLVHVDYVQAPYESLGTTLNSYLGCLVCNMEYRRLCGRFALKARSWLPDTHGLRPGPEPMLKNFEAAASGCAVIGDNVPDLAELGFEDSDTMIVYQTVEELLDRLQHYRGRPEELRSIGTRGAALCRSRHTWDHRADQFARLIRGEEAIGTPT